MVDVIILPTKNINSECIIDEIINYIDKYCIKKKIEHSKFEIYLDFKLNKIIQKQLLKNHYIKKKKISDFSFKSNIQIVNREILKENFYLTNIFKAGR